MLTDQYGSQGLKAQPPPESELCAREFSGTVGHSRALCGTIRHRRAL